MAVARESPVTKRKLAKKRAKAKAGDTPVTRAELRAVERFKETPRYRGAVRAGQDAQPAKQRAVRTRQAVQRISTGVGRPEDAVRLHANKARADAHVRDRKDATWTGMTDRDRRRVLFNEAVERARKERLRSAATRTGMADEDRAEVLRHQLLDDRGNLSVAKAKEIAERERKRAERGADRGGDLGERVEALQESQRKGFEGFKTQYAGIGLDDETLKRMYNTATHKKSPALHILEQFTRGSSAVAGGVSEGIKHVKKHGVGGLPTVAAAAAGGAQRGAVKNDRSFQQVLEKDLGIKGKGVGTAGLALDIALDPTTYVTFGMSAPANAAAKTAMRAAKAAGRSESEAMALGKRVYDTRAKGAAWDEVKADLLKVAKPEQMAKIEKGAGLTRRGVRVGVGLGRPTADGRVTRATAKLRKDKPVTREVEGAFREALEAAKRGAVYSARPAEIHPLEWEVIRRSGRVARTTRTRGERTAQKRIRGYLRFMKKNDLDEATTISAVAHALEADDLTRIPEGPMRELGARVQADLAKMADDEVAAGIREAFETVGSRQQPEVVPVTADPVAAVEHAKATAKGLRQSQSALGKSKRTIERERLLAQVELRGIDPKTGEVSQRMVESLQAFADDAASKAAKAKSVARRAERDLQRAQGAAGKARVTESPTTQRVAELREAADTAAEHAHAAREALDRVRTRTGRAQGRAERMSRADELAMRKGERAGAQPQTVRDLEEFAALRLLREPEAADLAKAKGQEAAAAERAAGAAEKAKAHAEEFGRRLEGVDESLQALKGDKTWPELKGDLEAEIVGIGQRVADWDDMAKAMKKMATGGKLSDVESALIARAADAGHTIDDVNRYATAESRLLSQRQAQLREATETFGGAAGRAAVAADEAKVTKRAADKAAKTKTQQEKARLHQSKAQAAKGEYETLREVTAAHAKAAREARATVKSTKKEHRAQSRAHEKSKVALEEYLQEARGYFPRMLTQRAEKAAKSGESAVRSPGAMFATVTSKKARRDRRAMENMPKETAERYITDSVVPLAQRMLDTGHGLARVEFLRSLAPLSRPVREIDDPLSLIRQGKQDFVVMKDNKLTPAFREIDTVEQAQAKLQKLIGQGADVRHIPQHFMDEALAQAERGRTTSKTADNIAAVGFDRVQGFIKTWQTVPNPGYHMTNLIGDLFNARLGGARGADLAAAVRQLKVRNTGEKINQDLGRALTFDPPAKEFDQGGKVRAYGKDPATGKPRMLTDAQVVLMAQQHGAIQMGFAGQELRQLVDPVARAGKGKKAMEGIRSFNEAREDFVRLASFTRALKQGLDFDEAAAKTNRHHFDYSDLTEAERGTMRRLLPFYTFMARNLPLQMRSTVQSPGRYATVEKTRDQSAEASGLDEDFAEKLQAWQQRAVPFALPGMKIGGLPTGVAPKLPLTDLNLLTASPSKQWQELLQRSTPIAKTPFEQFERYSTFFHAPVTKELVPAPDTMGVDKLLEAVLPGDAIKEAFDRRTGEMKPAWSWRIDQILRTLPISGLLANMSASGRERYEGQDLVALSNYLTGPRRFPIDFNAAGVAELYERKNNLERQAEYLKSRVPAGERPAPDSREKWGGKVREIMDEIADIDRQVRVLDEKAGIYQPRGRKPKKGRSRRGPRLGGGDLSSGTSSGLGSF